MFAVADLPRSKEYATDADDGLVRDSIHAIGQCARIVPNSDAVERCSVALMGLMRSRHGGSIDSNSRDLPLTISTTRLYRQPRSPRPSNTLPPANEPYSTCSFSVARAISFLDTTLLPSTNNSYPCQAFRLNAPSLGPSQRALARGAIRSHGA